MNRDLCGLQVAMGRERKAVWAVDMKLEIIQDKLRAL